VGPFKARASEAFARNRRKEESLIFPFWLNLSQIKRAPVTTMLLVLNLFFFVILPSKNGVNLPAELSQKVSQKDFIVVQSHLYENFLKEQRPEEWRSWVRRFYQSRESLEGGELMEFWFQLSFRDGIFLKNALNLPEYPSSLRYGKWKKIFLDFSNYQKRDFSGLFGVSINGGRWTHYITYQFVHAGPLHLFSNMIILVLFGILIEIQSGSWAVLLLYLFGGAAGGLFYSFTTGNNMAPLIGASGSVSALITFLLITEPRRYLRFFYFFFPNEDYFGDIYLSKWWMIPLLVLGDLNAILTTPDWNLSVAHTAHLGAIMFGLISAISFKLFYGHQSLAQTLSWISHPEDEPPIQSAKS
jgi:membrane associated rhomboid family serine protease